MKKLLFVLPIFITIFQSCTQSIDINDLNISNTELKVTFLIKNSSGLENIYTNKISNNSKELKYLNNWLINNSKEWENSIASFSSPKISLTNDNFRFLIFTDFVVIGYSDKNNKTRQLTKKVDSNEFEFLNNLKK
jgi:hypothetical protein